MTETAELRRSEADLGRQVQLLLKQQLESKLGRVPAGQDEMQVAIVEAQPRELSSDVVISEHLVTFKDVMELQTRNKQLLKVVRRLSQEREEALAATAAESIAGDRMALQEAVKQLDQMSAARVRQEEMVSSIIQQRDMYRLLLAQHDQKYTSGSTSVSSGMGVPATPGSSMQPPGTPQTPDTSGARDLHQTVQRLERELSAAKNEAEARGRSEKDAISHLQEAHDDAAAARREAKHADAERNFFQSRYESLIGDLTAKQKELEAGASRLTAMQANIISLQNELETKSNSVDAATSELGHLRGVVARNEAQLAISADAEDRLKQEVAQTRQELNRSGALMDSLQKIERGFSARAQEERAAMEADNTRLERTCTELRRELNDALTLSQSAGGAAAGELRSVRSKLDESAAHLLAARESLVKEQGACRAATDRAELLEKQLAIAQSRLSRSNLGGAGTEETAALQVTIDTLTADLEASRDSEKQAQDHIKQYKAIAAAKDKQLEEMTTASTRFRDDQSKKTAEAEAKAESLAKELQTHKNSIRDMLEGIIKEKDAAEDKVAQVQRELKESEALVKGGQDQVATANKQVEQLKAELETYQKSARTAQASYERETKAHADALGQLRELEERYTAAKKLKDDAEDQVSKITTDLVKAEAEWSVTRTKLTEAKAAAEARAEGLTSQNDLLHSQLQSTAQQLERLQKERHQEAEARASIEGTGATTAAGEGEETQQLRKSLSKMQEICRYVRNEKAIVDASLEAAQSQAARHQASLEQSQTALRQARAELKRLGEEKENAARSEAEHQQLVERAETVAATRESNTLLRQQYQEAHAKAQDLQKQVTALSRRLEPKEQAEQRLKTQISQLEADVTSYKSDAASWKKRVQGITSSYNQIDPEDHRALGAERDSLKTEKAALEKERDALRKMKEEAVAKALAERREAAEQLRKEKSAAAAARRSAANTLKEKEEALAAAKAAASKAAKEKEESLAQAAKASAEARAASNNKETLAQLEAVKNQLTEAKQQHQKSLEHQNLASDRLRNILRKQRQELEEERTKNKTLAEKLEKVEGSLAAAAAAVPAKTAGVKPVATSKPGAAGSGAPASQQLKPGGLENDLRAKLLNAKMKPVKAAAATKEAAPAPAPAPAPATEVVPPVVTSPATATATSTSAMPTETTASPEVATSEPAAAATSTPAVGTTAMSTTSPASKGLTFSPPSSGAAYPSIATKDLPVPATPAVTSGAAATTTTTATAADTAAVATLASAPAPTTSGMGQATFGSPQGATGGWSSGGSNMAGGLFGQKPAAKQQQMDKSKAGSSPVPPTSPGEGARKRPAGTDLAGVEKKVLRREGEGDVAAATGPQVTGAGTGASASAAAATDAPGTPPAATVAAEPAAGSAISLQHAVTGQPAKEATAALPEQQGPAGAGGTDAAAATPASATHATDGTKPAAEQEQEQGTTAAAAAGMQSLAVHSDTSTCTYFSFSLAQVTHALTCHTLTPTGEAAAAEPGKEDDVVEEGEIK
ncbi:unnamed protein product [Chrysoparadoxa australica]